MTLKITTDNIATTALQTLGGGVKITSLTYPNGATAADPTGSETITVTGTGFNTGAKVYIDTTLCTTTYVSATSLTFVSPAKSVASYHLFVYNTDGSNGMFPAGMVYSSTPTWITSSGALASAGTNASYSQSVSATGDGAVTYSVTSGSLPSGLTLSSSGTISGTTSDTTGTSTFTITATDSQNQTASRSFSIQIISTAFTISPAVGGITNWSFATNGPLTISTAGTYTLTPLATFVANVKMWGGGGGSGNQAGTGGGGGSSTGSVTFSSGVAHVLVIGQGGPAGAGASATGGGGVGDINRGNGGGYSGIFRNSQTQGNAVLMAGGGGGAGGGIGSSAAGAGGGTSGQAGNTTAGGSMPGGGTQIAGGTGSGSGAALQGGGGLSGGGGGYFGGGAGGDSGSYAPAAGGGSGYINNSYVTSGNTYTGNGNTPGNNADSDRGTSGNARSGSVGAGNDGKIIITG
jgi:hypothetical protein